MESENANNVIWGFVFLCRKINRRYFATIMINEPRRDKNCFLNMRKKAQISCTAPLFSLNI